MANDLGRNRKPSAIRQLEGNRSRTEIPPDLPLEGLPNCPDNLSERAAAHFRFVAGELGSCGVVKRLDTEALAVMAALWDAFWLAHDANDIDAMVKVSARWSNMAGKFGLTPSDRAKIMAFGSAPKQVDPDEDRFFKIA